VIISENRKPTLDSFRLLMKNTDRLLNTEAVGKDGYYSHRNGTELEEDVYDALNRTAKGTLFEGTIKLVSGASFPDIVANRFYGVEVKSTNKNHWRSIGSSILESTRISDVERIFLTFGKLGKPVEFRSRPYEDVLYGISVTHYPRYQIDMDLRPGETIFDKMGVSYDELRLMENPVAPVSKYYKSLLKPGETLWWADNADEEEAASPPMVRLWTATSAEEKEELTVQGYALFPEVLAKGNNKKYNRYALWLVKQKGIVNTNIRDSFSAGGKVSMRIAGGIDVLMPAAFGRIKKYHELIEETLYSVSEDTLKEYWETDYISENRLKQWCEMIAEEAASDPLIDYGLAWKVLSGIFPGLEVRHNESKTYVYSKNDGSQLRVAEDPKKYANNGGHKIIETPFASIREGDTVQHKLFGVGVVQSVHNGYIYVSFADGVKQFSYPQSLQQGFLQKID